MNDNEYADSLDIIEENYLNAIKNITEINRIKVSKLTNRITELEKINYRLIDALTFIGHDLTCYSLEVATKAARKVLEEK